MQDATRHDTHRAGDGEALAKAGHGVAATLRMAGGDNDLLLREMRHRCGNDLQLIVSLLELQSRRSTSDETRQVLGDVGDRVRVLARSRSVMNHGQHLSLETALQQVREGLQAHADARAILVSVDADGATLGLSAIQITTLSMVVHELATNAIKHAFGCGRSGQVHIRIDTSVGRDVIVTVEDDGDAFTTGPAPKSGGLGLELAKRLMASVDGLFIMPPEGSKAFELRVPITSI